MAKKIQAGEQESNPNFSGFVFQGNAYEGLTCNALEWIASAGGGHIIDNGKATDQQREGTDDPGRDARPDRQDHAAGVTSYQEDQTEHAFDNGDAAFARNWPYQYGIGAAAGSKVKGKFSVTVLPHGASGKSVGTVGGWQLAVSKYSKHQGATIEFVRYMTSPRGREVRRDHQLERPDDPVGGQGQGGREDEPVPEARDRERCARHAAREVPGAHYNEARRSSTRGSTRS